MEDNEKLKNKILNGATETTANKRACDDCDSTSMEMCLLIRHCKYWANPYKAHEYK